MIEQELAIKEELASLTAAFLVNLELSLNSSGVDGAKLVEEVLPRLLGTARGRRGTTGLPRLLGTARGRRGATVAAR